MKCIKCGVELREDAVFCDRCGSRQKPSERKYRRRENGTGSISKLSGRRKKPWVARKNGVSIGTFATRTEAQKALDRLVDVPVNDLYNMTFQDVFKRWKAEHERKISKKSMKDYDWLYGCCRELHGMTMRKILRSDYQAVIIRMELEGKSKGSCQKMRVLLGQLGRWAMEEGITLNNPAEGLNTVAQQKAVRETFMEAEIEAIKKSSLPAAEVALILIACGCRPGELFKVPLRDCFDDHFIGGSKTQAGKNRVIPIGPDGVEAYRRMRDRATAAGGRLLIDGYEGNKVYANYAKREWKELVEEIGRPGVVPYSCRHTFITRAIRAGVDLPVLEAIVGHVDRETTRIYTHLQAPDLVNAVSGMEFKNLKMCNKSVTSGNFSKTINVKKFG